MRSARLIGHLGTAGLLLGASFGVAASVATAPAAVTDGVVPLSHTIDYRFGAAPTTAQCEAQIGLACYDPAQYQAAYDMAPLYAKGLDGKGKTIVLVDSFGSPTIGHDLATFDKTFGLQAPPRFTVLQPDGPVPAFDPGDPTMVGWAEETSLDVEYSHAMAPGANILLVETPVAETEGLAGIPQIVSAERYVISHHLGDVISQSFAATEGTFPSRQSLLAERGAYFEARNQKVTMLAATGDQGVSSASNTAGTLLYTHRVVNWPASDPLVTAVGGTQLHLNQAGGRLLADNVWNDTNVLGSPAAGGGGSSSVFARPAYQNSVESVAGSMRATPDVSMSAAVDGAALVYLGFLPSPGLYLIGGTSEASPLFSGVVAIADQAAGHDLGAINPELYALAAKDAPGLVDVTTGNNTVTFDQNGKSHTVAGYLAGSGYDMASGLGTVDGADLVSELAGS